MSNGEPQYQPGDVVNGHILGGDMEWHPIEKKTSPPPPPPPPPPLTSPPSQPEISPKNLSGAPDDDFNVYPTLGQPEMVEPQYSRDPLVGKTNWSSKPYEPTPDDTYQAETLNNAFIWCIAAVVPAVWIVLDLLLGVEGAGVQVLIGSWIAFLIFVILDERAVKRAFPHTKPVSGSWIILIPVYLWKRRNRTGENQAPFITFMILFSIDLLILLSFFAFTFEGSSASSSIEEDLASKGVNATVVCPEELFTKGATFICTITPTSTEVPYTEAVVTVQTDSGYFIWEYQ